MNSTARAASLLCAVLVLAAAACASAAKDVRASGAFEAQAAEVNRYGGPPEMAVGLERSAVEPSAFSADAAPMVAGAAMPMLQGPVPSLGQGSTGPVAAADQATTSDASSGGQAPRGPRLVIYRGNLAVLVPSVDEASARLASRVEELGGYVESQSGSSGSNVVMVSLRVPALRFKALTEEIGAFGQVTERQLSASDVTRQVFDIELRLETAERSRQRLLDLLKAATKMEEILSIEGEVRRLTN